MAEWAFKRDHRWLTLPSFLPRILSAVEMVKEKG